MLKFSIEKFNNFYKYAVRQNKILKNRIRLIRGMQKALSSIEDPLYKKYFEEIISIIRKDSFNHFLSLFTEDSKIITYSTVTNFIFNYYLEKLKK